MPPLIPNRPQTLVLKIHQTLPSLMKSLAVSPTLLHLLARCTTDVYGTVVLRVHNGSAWQRSGIFISFMLSLPAPLCLPGSQSCPFGPWAHTYVSERSDGTLYSIAFSATGVRML